VPTEAKNSLNYGTSEKLNRYSILIGKKINPRLRTELSYLLANIVRLMMEVSWQEVVVG